MRLSHAGAGGKKESMCLATLAADGVNCGTFLERDNRKKGDDRRLESGGEESADKATLV